jgi:hypothetical protein
LTNAVLLSVGASASDGGIYGFPPHRPDRPRRESVLLDRCRPSDSLRNRGGGRVLQKDQISLGCREEIHDQDCELDEESTAEIETGFQVKEGQDIMQAVVLNEIESLYYFWR